MTTKRKATIVTITKLADTDEFIDAKVVSGPNQGQELRFLVPKFVGEWLQEIGAYDETPNYPIYND